jgi:uncharacterized protein (DUF58 family)
MSNSHKFKYLPPEMADSLKDFQVKVKRPLHGDRTGMHRSTAYGASVEFSDYREYVPGDPVNMIDWAVYARTDKHVIRRYEEEVNVRGYMFLDISESMAYRGKSEVSKLDFACSIAAALMLVLMNQQDAAGMMTFDSKIRNRFRASSSLEELGYQLREMERLKASESGDIEASMHSAAEVIEGRNLIFILSDFLQPSENIMRGINHLHHAGHEVVALQILDKAELNLGIGGMTELREMETGNRIIINPDDIRDAYIKAVKTHIENLRKGCSSLSVDYHLLDTSRPLTDIIHLLTVRM